MKLKHTPGPWYYEDFDRYTIGVYRKFDTGVTPINSDGYGSYKGIHVAELKHQNDNTCVSKKSAEANARLIAAAPELLETLIKLLSDPYENKDQYKKDVQDVIELIEKATGLPIEEVLKY